MEPLKILKRLQELRNNAERCKFSLETVGKEADRFMNRLEAGRERHWIISGRIPGSDEDTVCHIVTTAKNDNPWYLFVETVLYKSGGLPDGWEEDESTEYAYPGRCFEILGPPINTYHA